MRINYINNTTFDAKIKLAKPDTTKLIKGSATALAGTASLYTGLNALDVLPGEFAKDMYNSALNEQEFANPEGLNKHTEGNENFALSVGTTMLTSFPTGLTVTPLGSSSVVKAYSNASDNKQIPN